MRKNFGAKPYMYPQPVLIIASYGEDGTPDAMNAAWGGIADQNKIRARGAFTVSFADEAHVAEADYVGIVSANSVPDKLKRAGLHAVKSSFVDAPLIEEFPVALECKLLSYDEESECMLGEIVNVCADESVLDKNGKIDPEKLRPIAFDPVNSAYLKVGGKVGNAFHDGAKFR